MKKFVIVYNLCIVISFTILLYSCYENKTQDLPGIFDNEQNSITENMDLKDIQMCGEIIVLTIYGPTSYFEFHGSDFGNQYMLANEYAKSIGVSIRVDISRSQQELIEKLQNGEGDIIAYNLNVSDTLKKSLTYCGEEELTYFMDSLSKTQKGTRTHHTYNMAWAVRKESNELAQSLSSWMKTNKNNFFDIATIKILDKKGNKILPRRKIHAPILNIAKGEISIYNQIFKKYAHSCKWDWRLLAAQAYQESAFDNNAISWMGAMGLMQIMPSTARYVGIDNEDIFDPETNVKGAVKLIRNLTSHYSDINNDYERIKFVLAAYNAGAGHIDDARKLTHKNGKDPNKWENNVDQYVLLMSKDQYFNDPDVKYGYFRGNETYNYVYNIIERWNQYKKQIK